MVDKNFPSDYSELTSFAAANKLMAVDESEPADADKLKWSYYSTLMADIVRDAGIYFGHTPAGYLFNGYLDVSVSSGNITVAVKTLAGSNPSATDPVYIRIGDVEHTLTAALSVTISAGTNTFNSGGAELATHAVGYFVYLRYNATDGVCIGVARIPWGRAYSDFSATATNEKYAAWDDITSAAAGDVCQNVGYFEATLSGGAGYTWSSPQNVISEPTYKTNRLDWSPTFTGFSADPTGVHSYTIIGRKCFIDIRHATNGTSNATSFYMTLPMDPLSLTNAKWTGVGQYVDSGSVGSSPALCVISTGASTIIATKSWVGSNDWTGSGSKRMASMSMNYDL